VPHLVDCITENVFLCKNMFFNYKFLTCQKQMVDMCYIQKQHLRSFISHLLDCITENVFYVKKCPLHTNFSHIKNC
jgi:hypothetical protein